MADGQQNIVLSIFIGTPCLFFSASIYRAFKFLKLPVSKIRSAAIGGLVELQGKSIGKSQNSSVAPIRKIEASTFIWEIFEPVNLVI